MDKVKLDLTGWTLFSSEEKDSLINILHRAAMELVEILIRDEVYAYFPKEWHPTDGWGGDTVDDPLTLYIVAQDQMVLLKKISLSSALEESIKTLEEDGSFAEGLHEVSEAMKRLSARIDNALKNIH